MSPIRIPRVLVAAAAALGMLAGTGVAQAQTKLNVGYLPAGDWVPALIAKDKGFFEKRKLDITLTRVALVPNIPPSIVAGSLDIGVSTPTVLFDAAEGGIDVVAIAGGTRFTKDAAIFSVVARAGINVASAKDLEGKKVGVPGVRSIADVIFKKWLMQNGVQPAKVSIVETPFPQMRDLLKGGTVDAVAVLEPFRSRIVSDGTGTRVADFAAEVNPDMIGGVWIAKGDWARRNPEQVQAFRDALAEAIRFTQTNADEAREIEKKYLGFTSPRFPPYSLSVTPADLEVYSKMSQEVGYMKKPIDLPRLIAK
jgi:NitT/TauT family transport system substrate-binding protein